MAKYMLIKESIYSISVDDQLKYAQTIHAIPLIENVLHSERIYNLNDMIGQKVNSGDTLFVYSVFHIGQTYQNIMDVLYAYHMNHIKLCIIDIGYRDMVNSAGTPKSKNHDYNLLYGFLERFRDLRIKKNKITHKTPGRKKITWNGLTPPAQGIILFHIYFPRQYTAKQAYNDLIKLGIPLGINKLQQLSNDIREQIAEREKVTGHPLIESHLLKYLWTVYKITPHTDVGLKDFFTKMWGTYDTRWYRRRRFKGID